MKTVLRHCVTALALLLVVTLPGTAAAVLSPIVATINGNPITGEDFNWAMNRLQRVMAAQGGQLTEGNVNKVQQLTLQGLLKNELLFLESEALGIKIDPALVDSEYEKLKAQFPTEQQFVDAMDKLNISEGTIRRQIMRGVAAKQMLVNVFVPEVRFEKDNVEKYYQEHPDEFVQPELVRVRHILFKVKADSTEEDRQALETMLKGLQERIRQGEDFAELAGEYSDCDSAPRGGDLGYFRKGQLTPVLDTVVFAMQPGQISGVVKSEFGYHLLQVTERKEEKKLAFEQVKEQLTKQLVLRQAQLNAADFVNQRLESAEVKIFIDDLKVDQDDEKDSNS